MKTIQTKVWKDDLNRWEWIDCEHERWEQLVEDGWKLAYLDYERSEGAKVTMTRNGYINEFRNKPVRFQEVA